MVQARRIPNGEKLNPEYKKAKAVDEEQVYSYRKEMNRCIKYRAEFNGATFTLMHKWKKDISKKEAILL